MGRIYKNGINYSGGVVPASASVVSYDNTTSGLTSTNSQSAIDELARPTFTEATVVTNIATGESAPTLWGKIMRFMSMIGVDVANIAQPYQTNSTYGIGAFVSYNNKIYRCTTTITAGESFNATKWLNISLISVLTTMTTTSFQSYNTTYFTGVGASSITKIGRTVELNIAITPTVSLPSGTTILTLPVGYRPAYGGAKYFAVRSLNDATVSRLLAIDGTGNVTFADNNGNVPAGAYLDGYISFLTNQ